MGPVPGVEDGQKSIGAVSRDGVGRHVRSTAHVDGAVERATESDRVTADRDGLTGDVRKDGVPKERAIRAQEGQERAVSRITTDHVTVVDRSAPGSDSSQQRDAAIGGDREASRPTRAGEPSDGDLGAVSGGEAPEIETVADAFEHEHITASRIHRER